VHNTAQIIAQITSRYRITVTSVMNKSNGMLYMAVKKS
jgi:hypothetical protein